ncbi:acyl carrier protein phosphodiesterase [Psychroflexus planctonicus]|uniref:ACP phosphodiesterase n=1 Tax=Psychroflexus planctonicus TaxID=1526575 RepID=A0ABQ1SMS5_9FLAO|nr:ACP phosphodiesterase [Psychroflexus planctonicus]GGE42535.1 ACP phosphodiesterase [Psychroflexus planctonicus]
MNYLAHIYLSGDNKMIKIGNFIGDFVKGDPTSKFDQDIVYGIYLHRKIDRFTDTNAVVRKCRSLFFDEFSHYSGVITDVLFDYFLAKNWAKYSSVPLSKFVEDFYNLLDLHMEKLPLAVQRMYPHMVSGNWLVNYQKIEGIEQILFQMNKRTSNKPELQNSIATLRENHDVLENYFFIFFNELQVYVEQLQSKRQV